MGRWHVSEEKLFPKNRFELKYPEEFGEGPNKALPFDWRSYTLFGFLMGVRRDVIDDPVGTKGLAPDSPVIPEFEYNREARYQKWGIEPDDPRPTFDMGEHSFGYVTLRTLLEYDYERAPDYDLSYLYEGEFRRAGIFRWPKLTMRYVLGDDYFRDLELMKQLGEPDDVRFVFGFDS